MGIALFGRNISWFLLAWSPDVIGHFGPLIFCKDVTEHVLNLLL